MSYLRDNNIWEEEDEINWDVIEISKVDDKIIEILIDNLKLNTADLSETFFISFESLLKLGKKIEPVLDSYIKATSEIHNCKVEIFNFILDLAKKRLLIKKLKMQSPNFYPLILNLELFMILMSLRIY